MKFSPKKVDPRTVYYAREQFDGGPQAAIGNAKLMDRFDLARARWNLVEFQSHES